MSAEQLRRTSTQGIGWILFIGIMLFIAGILNVIYGIAGMSGSSFFVDGTTYIISDLNAWGWITLILGLVQIGAAYSVWEGHAFGRWFAIVSACFGVVIALLTLPGYPLWSLALGAISVLIIYGMAVYGGQD